MLRDFRIFLPFCEFIIVFLQAQLDMRDVVFSSEISVTRKIILWIHYCFLYTQYTTDLYVKTWKIADDFPRKFLKFQQIEEIKKLILTSKYFYIVNFDLVSCEREGNPSRKVKNSGIKFRFWLYLWYLRQIKYHIFVNFSYNISSTKSPKIWNLKFTAWESNKLQ